MNNKPTYYIYDLETYPNIFTFGGKFYGDDKYQVYELSDRRDDKTALLQALGYLQSIGVEMVGFNNVGFDYPIIHELLTNPWSFTYQKAYEICQQIITSQGRGFNPVHVKHSERKLPQIDIMKYCHFDNDAKRTSLKNLQFAMRSPSVEDLPFDVGTYLTHEQKDVLIQYNIHDIQETERFFKLTENLVDMRRELLNDGVLFGDVLNYNDVKIGVEYLVTRIGRNKCYAGGNPKGTFRTTVEFQKIILPKINYKTDVFNDVFEWFRKSAVYCSVKDAPTPTHKAKLAGVDFHFGVGGLHASADNKIFHSDDEYQIIDIDVSGMYPSVAIANRFAPEHLGESFVVAYKAVKDDRAKYAKGTAKNAMMKLAGNGAYGNFNNRYSPMFDPQCLYSVTINGQLQLLQLVEMIDLLQGTELIQGNTDGITLRIHKDSIPFFRLWCKEWEKITGLELEEVLYKRMWIRDVNNYIAEKMDGKLKLKGAYWYPENIKDYSEPVMSWHKDFSNLASIKAAVLSMTRNFPVEVAVRLMTDPFDFMLREKAKGETRIFIGEVKQLKTVRYYVSVSGEKMVKKAPPKGEPGQFKRANKLTDEFFNTVMKEIGKDVWDIRIHTKNKSKYAAENITAVQSGRLVKECNRAEKFNWNDVDWNYYIEEAKKLIVGSK